MAPIDLNGPSNDTPTLLRQWLAVYKGAAVPDGSFFAENRADAASQIVQITASIVGHGDRYYKFGDVTPSLLRLARKLGPGNLSPILAESLVTGEPKFAHSIGVHDSKSIVGRTGPRS